MNNQAIGIGYRLHLVTSAAKRQTQFLSINLNQRWSRGHKARGQGQGQGHKKNPRPRPRPRTAFPRTDTLEAKDRNARGQGQGPRTQSASALQKKKKKKGLHKNFSGDLQKKKKKKGLHKNFSSDLHEKTLSKQIFQPLHKSLTFQKIVLSSSRGQANFRGLEASRPRPRPRTSKSVLEDVLEAKDVLEDSTSDLNPILHWLFDQRILHVEGERGKTPPLSNS